MRRRSFIIGLGGTLVLPHATVAAHPNLRVIARLSSTTATGFASRLAAYRQGLQDGGFAEGKDVRIE